ncbi:MAG: hypothetical protein HRU15_19110 [Planctomycetes bacterium]|nr:hypothetical protein [Planctomycetota bacterium]
MINERVAELIDDWDIEIAMEHAEYLCRNYKDPDIYKLGLLVVDCEIDGLDIEKVNESLRDKRFDPWPDDLFAFSTMGCGDYTAYFTDDSESKIVYIDPDYTVAENLAASDAIMFDSFAEWVGYGKKK